MKQEISLEGKNALVTGVEIKVDGGIGISL